MTTYRYNAVDHGVYITTHDDKVFKLNGPSDGDYITASFVNDAVTSIEGGDGDVQHSQRVASLAKIGYTALWGSNVNKILNKVFRDQQKSLYPKKIQIKQINDLENITIADSESVMIVKPADYTTGVTAGPRPWTFDAGKFKFMEEEAP